MTACIFHSCGKIDHECDDDGTPVLLLADTPYEVPDTPENRSKYEEMVRGGSVTCSQCGMSAYQQEFWM